MRLQVRRNQAVVEKRFDKIVGRCGLRHRPPLRAANDLHDTLKRLETFVHRFLELPVSIMRMGTQEFFMSALVACVLK